MPLKDDIRGQVRMAHLKGVLRGEDITEIVNTITQTIMEAIELDSQAECDKCLRIIDKQAQVTSDVEYIEGGLIGNVSVASDNK